MRPQSHRSSAKVTGVATLLVLLVLLVLRALTELSQRGAAGLQPRLPQQIPSRHLALHRLHGPQVSLGGLLHRGQDGAEGRLSVGGQRRGLGRVLGEIEEQRWVVVGHVARRAEADVCVDAGRPTFWVEVGREVKGLPH